MRTQEYKERQVDNTSGENRSETPPITQNFSGYLNSIDQMPLSPLQAFLRWEQQRSEETYLVQPFPQAEVLNYSWRRVGREARAMATYLESLHLQPGSRIAILSKNCAHWIMADLAIWMSGHVSVPIFSTASPDYLKHVLNHSEAELLFVGKVDRWDTLKEVLDEGFPLVAFPYQEVPRSRAWNDLIRDYEPLQQFKDRASEDLATIIYTSGTTGAPKGVMHSFRSMSSAVYRASDIFQFNGPQTMFSYLPLSHVVERMFVEIGSLYFGFRIHFSESRDSFFQDLRSAKPSMFFGVPQVWLAFQREIRDKLPSQYLEWLLNLPLVSKWLRRHLLEEIGLQNALYCVGGAAPVSISLMKWYQKIGIHIMEAYGMTENMGYSHCTRKGEVALGSVGRSNPGVDVKIDTNGEVLVKSASNMMGYYKDPELTAETISSEGYVRTGDLGELDSQGRLFITGRIKDIFKTAEGKYISPVQVEHLLLDEPFIEQVCVTGAGLKAPLALITLSELAKELFVAKDGRTAISEELVLLLEKMNNQLEVYERLSHIVILEEPWLPENGKLTPSFKLKRNVIEAAYKQYFAQWSHSQEPIIWLF